MTNVSANASANAYVNVDAIKASYAPYHIMKAFDKGYNDYMAGRLGDMAGVAGQAYDRGANAAMRVMQANQWVHDNVGAN